MTPEQVLDRYFQALRDEDWQALGACVAEGVRRTGPYLDVVEGREAYVDFLAGIVPKLANYELRVRDVKLLADGGAVVRLSESLDTEGVRSEHPEMLLFGFDADGLIAEVDIYLKRVS